MSEGPTWIVVDKAPSYPDGRFDGVTPPLDPQQPTPEQIAIAARLAAPDMETVFRLYGHIQTHPLPELRALLDMLTPFAPKWTATEEEDE